MHRNLLGLLIILILDTGCLRVVPGAKKSGINTLTTVFFTGTEGNQYFIKPLKFHGSLQNNSLEIDVTFRFKDSYKGNATINISFELPYALKNIDSIVISSFILDKSAKLGEYNSSELQLTEIRRLFLESGDKSVTSRYTAKADLALLKRLWSTNSFYIRVFHSQKELNFNPTSKTIDKIGIIYQGVFNFD